MSDDEAYLSLAIGRFAEASQLHAAIHALSLSNRPQPGQTPEQSAQRSALISIMLGLLRRKRNDAVQLGIYEWQRAVANLGLQDQLPPPKENPQ